MISFTIISCKDKYVDDENYFIEFQPRNCNIVGVLSKQKVETKYNNEIYFDFIDLTENTLIKSSNYTLVINTSNGRGQNDFDPSLSSLEKEIELNYKKYESSLKAKSSVNDASSVFTNKIDIRYRIDGVVNFNISSLDAPLFGKPIGTSLNQYFEIFKYDPDFIASYESKRLLYGYTDKVKPTAIDEWLSLSPMAQPTMFLRLNTIPENLPVTLRFKVDMETTDGITISDTTKVITLTN